MKFIDEGTVNLGQQRHSEEVQTYYDFLRKWGDYCDKIKRFGEQKH